jgi:hypothetical protein
MFWSNSSQKLSVVCDVGSASVGVAYVLFSKNRKPKILSSVRVPIAIQATPEAELEPAIARFLDDAFTLLTKQKPICEDVQNISKKVDHVFVFFSSPWYVSKTRTVLLQKDKPFLLKKDSIEALVVEEEQKFQKDVLDGKYEHVSKSETSPIERELVRVKLNGYETVNPYMKEASNVELTLFMSLALRTVLGMARSLAQKHFHTDEVFAHTFPLASFGAIRSMFPHESDFTLVDVAGEVTDITVVRSSVIAGSESFSLGRNSLVRNVGALFGIPSEIALSFLGMYEGDTLEASARVSMEKVVGDFASGWLAKFLESKRVISPTAFSTEKIFLTCDDEVRVLLTNTLMKNTEGGISFAPVGLSPASFAQTIEYAKHVSQDPFIALETAFLSIHGFA